MTTAIQTGTFSVIRRDSTVVPFDAEKIKVALTKAFLAVEGKGSGASQRVRDAVEKLHGEIIAAVLRNRDQNAKLFIEDIQDQVELVLMRNGEYKVARAYVLYREERTRERQERQKLEQVGGDFKQIKLRAEDGSEVPLDEIRLLERIERACAGLESVDATEIFQEAMRSLFEGASLLDLDNVLVFAARGSIEKEPNYTFVAARLLLDRLRRETTSFVNPSLASSGSDFSYVSYFKDYIRVGIENDLLDPELAHFDLDKVGEALVESRDHNFTYLSMQTLYDRYFLHVDGTRIELPQAFFMRVAMGLALREINREEKAIEFYTALSNFEFMCSTPTLFNSGTTHSQLSSCFLTTIDDDLGNIYGSIRDNALLSKYAGGIGNDWTNVRGMGAHIKGTNGKSLGVVPFLKVANDTAVAVNQGGKRKGAVCAYLEVWHVDIEEFLELRKNTGDDRRRTHDMNSACWVPDLFMKRVSEGGDWSLFSPDEAKGLHDTFGTKFEELYNEYEQRGLRGELRVHKRMPAKKLWRKMLTMLFETGHPWITFKDACNLRSPQQHAGVVHSSNLCTEITLNTNDKEIAVCNLGSINLPAHVNENGVDHERLRKTVRTAMRMLDNVIDINFYTVPQARYSNLRHRPVGMGIMGFQDALYKLRLPYTSDAAVQFADTSMEAVSYYAIEASSDLAAERGTYASYQGSLWDRGILPVDSLQILEEQRGGYVDVDRNLSMDWSGLRQKVAKQGMRNSNTMAIAPTATISNICNVSQSIEPTYQNLFVKANMSGDFTVINPYLVDDLKARDLWDEVMVNDLKYFDGKVSQIDRIPEDLKELYATAFEIKPQWLIDAGSRRQKWIDQSQSLNLYLSQPSGRALDEMYRYAWERGLKTTYYLRTMGATHAEKTTVQGGQLNAVPNSGASEAPKTCSITDPDCEACQ